MQAEMTKHLSYEKHDAVGYKQRQLPEWKEPEEGQRGFWRV